MNRPDKIAAPSPTLPGHARPDLLETLAATHTGFMLVFSCWAFGGAISWAATVLSILGFGSVVILITAAIRRHRDGNSLRSLHFLWPLLGLNLLVVLSLFQPNLRPVWIEGARAFIARTDVTGPACARADLAWQSLLLFDALYLAGFNLLFAVQHRRTLWMLHAVLFANTLCLSVFGTFQALTGADGLYFGAVTAPGIRFFASFVYRNHWGAFALLMLASSLGIFFHTLASPSRRGFWHSPAPASIAGLFLLTATIPLCGARACTLLAMFLVIAGFVHGTRLLCRQHPSASRTPRLLALAGLVTLAFAGLYWISGDTLHLRLEDTRRQIAQVNSARDFNRIALYSDTLRMASDRPWFGWGLDSYGTVFSLYNTQSSPVDGLPVHYENAHSDWLQWLAETGITGISCLLLLIIVPLVGAFRSRPASPMPRDLLTGCAILLVYSTFEFPLANPAVLLCFWVCLFVAVRWSQLENADRPA